MKNPVLKYEKGLYMKNYEMTKRVAYLDNWSDELNHE
jgi:hypothetical protein